MLDLRSIRSLVSWSLHDLLLNTAKVRSKFKTDQSKIFNPLSEGVHSFHSALTYYFMDKVGSMGGTVYELWWLDEFIVNDMAFLKLSLPVFPCCSGVS